MQSHKPMASENLKLKTKRGLYWNMFSNLANYGMQFVIGIFLARLLSPEEFGIVAMPAVFTAVAGCFISGCFHSALVRKPDLTESDLSTAYYYSQTVGVLMYIVMFFAAPWIADFYHQPVLTALLRFSCLGFILGPIEGIQTVQISRNIDFKTNARIGIAAKLCSGVLGIAMAFMGWGVWALVVAQFLTGFLTITLYYRAVRWLPRAPWSRESFRYLWGYGNKMMVSSLMDIAYSNIYPVVIGKFYSAASLGVYTRAQGYAAMPSSNVTGTIASVSFPVLSKMQGDPQRLAQNYRRMLRTAAFVIFPMMLGLSALAKPLILVMITAKWAECIPLLQIMCLSMMWYPIHALNLNALTVTGRSDLFLRLEIIKKVLGIAIMCYTLPRGLIVMCWGSVVASVICLAINTYYTGKLLGVGLVVQMRDLAHILALCAVMWAAVSAVTLAVTSLVAQIAIGIPLGVAIYAGGSFLFRFPELQDVLYMLKVKE